jgi:hypothetical protein
MMTTENGWKVEQYHGAKLMVRAERRQQENAELVGHGDAWDFTVVVADPTASAAEAEADLSHAVKSDRDVFYSTQVIAEQMGFIKGRELVEHRADPLDKQGEHGKSTL